MRDAGGWRHVRTDSPVALLTALVATPGVDAYRAFAPAPPPAPPADPADLAPATPRFDVRWDDPAPFGMDVREGRRWPGGRGELVAVADVEYAWDDTHEDLVNNPAARWEGDPHPDWAGHGTAVLGIVGAADDGFGTTGGVPEARLAVVHPLRGPDYRLADAVDAAAARLLPGDVLLVEQQVASPVGFAPASTDPAVFDAIRAAVDAGIVVIEPAGNGGVDLDDPFWEGWFDRTHDSGSILVGAGLPGDAADPRARWEGSCYGSRVDVQGWGVDLVSPADGDLVPADLWFPDSDPRQGYGARFGGTSGAAAQVAAVAAQVQSISLALHGRPVPPRVLRGWMRATGVPQPPEDAAATPIGPAPDVRALVRTYLAP